MYVYPLWNKYHTESMWIGKDMEQCHHSFLLQVSAAGGKRSSVICYCWQKILLKTRAVCLNKTLHFCGTIEEAILVFIIMMEQWQLEFLDLFVKCILQEQKREKVMRILVMSDL